MPEFDSDGNEIVSVLRIIEYKGTKEWITKTLELSKVPIYGVKVILNPSTNKPTGCSIRSGMANWDVPASDRDEGNEQESRPVIPIPPPSSHGPA
jgi:hypothetical protein